MIYNFLHEMVALSHTFQTWLLSKQKSATFLLRMAYVMLKYEGMRFFVFVIST